MQILSSLIVVFLLGCGGSSNPADELGSGNVESTPVVQSIDLAGASVLALREKETAVGASYSPSLSRVSHVIPERCDELGRMDGVAYKGLDIKDKQGGSLVPCFKNVHFIKDDMIYGEYRRERDKDYTSFDYASFITDSAGKVHHLSGRPKKPTGFKSDKLIRMYKGKPLYLNYSGFLVTLNLETDEEENILNAPVGNFVIIPKNTGEHIVYHDLGGGHIMRPNGGIEDLPELNTYRFYYRNASNDLTYISNRQFKNLLLDPDGFILDRAATGIPIAHQKWVDGLETGESIGVPPPSSPGVTTSMSSCEISGNLMICEGNYLKGYILAGSDDDVKEIKWCDYGHCSGLNPLICVADEYIYYYSNNNTATASRQLTKINKDLSSFEHIMTNIVIDRLTCVKDGSLLISGRNMDTSVNERFHFDPALRIKTMITENITEFIN